MDQLRLKCLTRSKVEVTSLNGSAVVTKLESPTTEAIPLVQPEVIFDKEIRLFKIRILKF